MNFWEFLDRNGEGVVFVIAVAFIFSSMAVASCNEQPKCDEAAEVSE